jgi:hypothetical protein
LKAVLRSGARHTRGFRSRHVGIVALACAVAPCLVASAGAAEPPGPVPASRPPPDPKAAGDPFTPTPRTGVGGVPPAPRCTISGTRRGETLRGTPKKDVICGLGGADRIFAGGGDIVRGGTGADRIFAANAPPKPDVVIGDRGRDRARFDGYDKVLGVELLTKATSFSVAALTASGDGAIAAGRFASSSAPSGAGDVPNQDAFPITSAGWHRNKFVGKLVDGAGSACTGTLVAANIVLTAARCLNRGAFVAQPVTWTPSLWGAKRPYGSFRSRQLVVLRSWPELFAGRSPVAAAVDYGFVVLQPNAQGRNAGDVLGGWLKIMTEYQGRWYWSLGYAAGGWFGRYGARYPYFCLSRLAAFGAERDGNGVPWYELGIGCYMTGGATGGPWLVDVNSNNVWNHVASVNSHCWPAACARSGGFAQNMWGPYFTRSVLDLLEYARTL